MDVEQLRDDVREGRIPVDRLVLAAGTLCSTEIFLRSILELEGERPRLGGLMDAVRQKRRSTHRHPAGQNAGVGRKEDAVGIDQFGSRFVRRTDNFENPVLPLPHFAGMALNSQQVIVDSLAHSGPLLLLLPLWVI